MLSTINSSISQSPLPLSSIGDDGEVADENSNQQF